MSYIIFVPSAVPFGSVRSVVLYYKNVGGARVSRPFLLFFQIDAARLENARKRIFDRLNRAREFRRGVFNVEAKHLTPRVGAN